MSDTIVTTLYTPEPILTELQVGQGPAGVGANPASFTAAENLTAGMLVNITPAGAVKADKGHYTKEAHGFVSADAIAGAAVTVNFAGQNTHLTGLTVGPVYLGSAGGVQSIAPNVGPGMCQLIGYASAPTVLNFLPSIPVVLAGTSA